MPNRLTSCLRSLLSAAGHWRHQNIPDVAFIFIVAFIIGVFAGFASFVLKWLIGVVSEFVARGAAVDGPNYRLLYLPLTGLLLTTIYSRYIARKDMSHGTTKLIDDVKRGNYGLPSGLIYSPVVACSLTLGFGGSAGSEGPIAYSGAAIGSSLGRAFGVSPRFLMILFGCGAGAAIAGIYKAPLGGVLYTLEVLKLELSTLSVVALMMTCLVAAMVSFSLSAYVPDVSFTQHVMFEPSVIPVVLALGVFIGFYSLYYFRVMGRVGSLLGRCRNIWVRCLIAGSVLAVLVFIYPTLYGEGFGSMIKVLDGDTASIADASLFHRLDMDSSVLLLLFGGLLLAKAVAVGATNNGGGVSGNFTPALFAGCMAGMFFALAVNTLFHTSFSPANFALMGMAGVMAGVIRAPLMAIFLTTEITQNLDLLLPITLTASISFCMVKLFSRQPFFESEYIFENLKEPSDDGTTSPKS